MLPSYSTQKIDILLFDAHYEENLVDPELIQKIAVETSTPFENEYLKGMFEGWEGKSGQLSGRQIVRLAAVISADDMSFIAEGYMGIDYETIQNIKRRNRGKAEAFNRDVIKKWMESTPENQPQVTNICKLLADSKFLVDCKAFIKM